MGTNLEMRSEAAVPRRSVSPLARMLLSALVVAVLTLTMAQWLPDDPGNMGVFSVVPSLFLIVYILWTKRILEALTLAALMGFIMVNRGGFFQAFNDSLTQVLMSEDMAWLFIVCGLMGSIISLIERTGGAVAFGEWVSRRAATRNGTLLWTWLLGVAIFIDDYLNSLTLGSCMAPVTDRHKVSREMLAYVVDSTAAPTCVLVPISTWAVFAAKLMEANGLAPEGQGMHVFIQTIPFNFYGWFAVLTVPLIILGVVPLFGPMRKAEQRARETGILAPPGSERIDIKAGEQVQIPDQPSLWNFFLPMIFLVGATVYFDLDMMKGVMTTMLFAFLLFVGRGVIDAEEYADVSVKGMKNMLLPLVMMVLAFTFAKANEAIGFTTYVIDAGTPYMSAKLMPVIVFAILGVTEFITGTNWGMYIIALPIVIPLAQAVGANVILVVAAVLSAGVWGSHVCFYSDATVLSSASSGCDNYQHALTQMPFGMLAAVLSAIAFLVTGLAL